MKHKVSPIETIWRGYRFRSRLDARWAVFFESIGLRWEYEPEGFEAPGIGRWLPDFRVWYPGRWQEESFTQLFEVKPDLATVPPEYWKRIHELSVGEALNETNATSGVIVLDGMPDKGPYYPAGVLAIERDAPRTSQDARNAFFLWCPKGRLWWDCRVNFEDYGDPEIADAICAARAARFEFGETPA